MRHPIYSRTIAGRFPQRGLSLIELMISITIGLLILSAITTLFVNQSRTRTELDKSNRMIDNGRYALEVLSENLRVAGFYGILDPSPLALPAGITDPCSTASADMADALRLHVGGYDAAAVNSAIASPPCSLASLKDGSDILVLRRANTSTPLAQTAAVNGTHYIQVSRCRFDIVNNFIIGTTPGNFIMRQRDCTETSTTPYADVRRFIVQTYFVSPNNNGSDGIPTLKRMELDPAGSGAFITTPLVEGIEYLQVEYGIDDPLADTDGDGTVGTDGIADSYVTCSACTIDNWSDVVSVKLHIIARNLEPTTGYTDTKTYNLGLAGAFGPFNDNYKRHAYTQVVRLVNPASRREP
ncbi:MAG: PilW family protein [Rhodocyclaceae bacterium]|nr:PilW family protein [Rhodocyclaceae bacterium]